MADLYRTALQARFAKAPQLPPLPGEDEEEDESGDSIGSLPTGMGPPAAYHTPNPAFTPISASGYFEQAIQVSVPQSDLDVRVYYTPPKFEDGTVIVCHHGAGYSGLTFACMAKEITDMSKGECGVLSYDARGHGKTKHLRSEGGSTEENLDIDVLTADLVNLVQAVFTDSQAAPSLLFVGHSLGGSVCVRACPALQQSRYRITGVAVVDIVEEFTLEALPLMHSLLNARPEGFDSQEQAIEWHVKTNTIHNPASARVSVPGIIVPAPEGSPPSTPAYLWRTPLRSTAPYWTSWFTGLSSKFLSARTARLLILAGTERLDRELMIGQMQGKFQLVVIPGVGHMVHEDDPTRMAEVLVEFWRRNERVVVGVKKVGEL
ncbi:protein phosphatase methylesterase [Trametes versicolor FP-101664 SS1]|uniref:protein phosphatase methylesterase n=1 Tax=Trametes versicolor (strain FP-101664) TaxID=717944 RepID=UPI0004621B7C|nr:protein phosphatase methylesterase [Trametes versicolor FP-101664 SS1]EIW57923.1 protein phosphatase methylesterase [Trametes versicolor FP-101664 SS1]